MADIGSLIIKLGVDTSGVMSAQVAVQQLASAAGASAAKANAAMALFSKNTIQSLNTMSQKFRTFGYLASITLTTPIIAFSKASINMAKTFEFSMAKIQGLAGIAASTTRQWSDELLKMAPAVASTPEKLAEALYFVASSGFKTAEALTITEMAAKGAAAGMGESYQIADMLVSAMNAYKSSGLTAAEGMDIFTAAVREGKIEADQFITTIGSVLPIASELGVSLDQVTAAMASMSLSGATAANSATYLRNVLQKLADPSAEVEKALNKMGTSGEALRMSLKEQGLLPTLEELRRLTAEYGDTMFTIFPNIRALIGALNLTGQNLEYNRKIFELVKNSTGDFGRAFAVASETMQFKWNTALSASRVALIQLGDSIGKVVLPIFEKLVTRLQDITDWYNTLHDSQKRLVIGIAGFIAVLGPASLAISVLGYGISGLLSLVNAAIAGFSALGVGLLAIPYVAIAAGIAAIAISIVKTVRKAHEWDRIQAKVNAQISKEVIGLDQAFARLRNVNEASELRAQAIQGINDQYGEYLSNMLTEKSTLEDITKAHQEVTDAMVARVATESLQVEKGKLIGNLAQAQTKYLNDFINGYREYIKVAGKNPLKAPEMSAGFLKELNQMINGMTDLVAGDIQAKEAVRIGLLPHLVVEQGQIVGVSKAVSEFVTDAEFQKYAITVGVDVAPIIDKYGGLYETIEAWKKGAEDAQPIVTLLTEITTRTQKAGYAFDSVRAFYDKWIKDIALKTGDAKYSFTSFSDAVYGYFNEKKLIDPMLETIQGSIDTYTSMGLTAKNTAEEVEKLHTRLENPILKKIVKEMEEEEDQLNRQQNAYKQLGIASDVAKRKQQLYLTTLEKLGQELDFSVAGDMMKIIYQRLKDLGDMSGDTGIEVSALAELMTEFAEKSDGIKYMAKNAERLGIEFNYAKEMAKLLTDTLQKLIENRGADTSFATDLSGKLINLHPEIYETARLLKDLDIELKRISNKGKFGITGFNVPEENQRAVGETLDKLIELRVNAKLLEKAFIPLAGAMSQPFAALIPFADILDKKIADLVVRYRQWGEAAEMEDLQRSAEIAKSQAEAYGSLGNQLDAVGKEINLVERKIHNLSANLEANRDAIIENAKVLELLKVKYLNIQSAGDIQYFEMLAQAFGRNSDQMELLGAEINYVENRLRLLSEVDLKDAVWKSEVEGWIDVLARLRAEQEKFEVMEDSLNSLGSVFSSLGDTIGGATGDVVKFIGSIIQAIPQIIDLVLRYGKAAQVTTGLVNAQTLATENAAIAKQIEVWAIKQGIVAKGVETAASTANAAATGTDAAASYANAGAKAVEAQASAVASGASIPPPGNLIAIALGVAAVIAGLAAAIPRPKKMATGGIIPAGFPNDTYPALLSSGEMVVPSPEKLKFPDIFKIIDKRITDAITGLPVSPYSKLHGSFDISFLEEVVRKALERGIDPYTALAIPHQETGGTPSNSGNPYALTYGNAYSAQEVDAVRTDPVGFSLDFLKKKFADAARIGQDTYAEIIQTYNGLGTIKAPQLAHGITQPTKMYGLQIPQEGINMKENPLYGKRIEDIRNNILMQSEELVAFVESIMKEYPQPTLPFNMIKKAEEPIEYAQALNTTDPTIESFTQLIDVMKLLQAQTLATTDATEGAVAVQGLAEGSIGKSLSASAAGGISTMVSTALAGGDVMGAAGSALSGMAPVLLQTLLSLIPGVGPIFSTLLSGVLGGATKGFAKMATGGVVPGGFPNDSFPALLTSGETVLPFDASVGRQYETVSGDVHFYIEGDRLVGILEKRKKVKSKF